MKKGRVFCSSDWHGCGKVAEKVFNYLQSEDTLYYLGDCQDRGKDGIAILDTLMTRPNTFYIKGNHDVMMADAIPYLVKDLEELGYVEGWNYNLWLQNGGYNTIYGNEQLPAEKWYEYKEYLDKASIELRYASPTGHTIIMEHAGYTPFDVPHRSHDPFWDRDHFYDIWGPYKEKDGLNADTTYLIHGHTPVQYLKFMYGYDGQPQLTKEEMEQKHDWLHTENSRYEWKPEIIRYCSGHKFDIDLCTIVSNRIALLDLDTFEAIYFDAD